MLRILPLLGAGVFEEPQAVATPGKPSAVHRQEIWGVYCSPLAAGS